MDLELGDKRKRYEGSKRSHKQWKGDTTSGIVGLTNDGYNLIIDLGWRKFPMRLIRGLMRGILAAW